MTVTLLGLLLISPTGSGKPFFVFSPTAEANFFSNDLELFEEVVGLVGEKYIYPPDINMNLYEYDQWIINTISEFYGIYYPLMKNYVFDRVLYWKLENSHNFRFSSIFHVLRKRKDVNVLLEAKFFDNFKKN